MRAGLSDPRLAAVRELHVGKAVTEDHLICEECGQVWPCRTAVALGAAGEDEEDGLGNESRPPVIGGNEAAPLDGPVRESSRAVEEGETRLHLAAGADVQMRGIGRVTVGRASIYGLRGSNLVWLGPLPEDGAVEEDWQLDSIRKILRWVDDEQTRYAAAKRGSANEEERVRELQTQAKADGAGVILRKDDGWLLPLHNYLSRALTLGLETEAGRRQLAKAASTAVAMTAAACRAYGGGLGESGRSS